VAIGTFDGVHRGHRSVVAGCDTVLTFDPHPRHVLRPGTGPAMLTDLTDRARALAALGVREVVVIGFDQAWAAVDAAAFVDRLLVGHLGAERVSVGADFRFGAGGSGSVGTLRADDRFRTTVAPTVTAGGAAVSSSLIRECVSTGALERAGRLLGRPYSLRAVAQGGGLLRVDPLLVVPPPGRYRATVGGRIVTVAMTGNAAVTMDDTSCPRGPVEIVFHTDPEPVNRGEGVLAGHRSAPSVWGVSQGGGVEV
jgi:riboflavin kinase/FMN adenylyltransferase